LPTAGVLEKLHLARLAASAGYVGLDGRERVARVLAAQPRGRLRQRNCAAGYPRPADTKG